MRRRRHGGDFFKADLRLKMPETVYILGPGLNGVDAWSQIPRGAFIITLNRGCAIPGIDKSLWMVMDGLCLKPSELRWFNKGIHYKIPRLFGGLVAQRIKCDFSFEHQPKWHTYPKYHFLRGVLRGGRGILGCALQACLWARKTKRVILVGCDGKGPYYDGSRNRFLKIPDKQVRNEIPDLQIMIDEMTLPDDCLLAGQKRPKRMEIFTLSETVLNIPRLEVTA